MRRILCVFAILVVVCTSAVYAGNEAAQYMQDISVTIKSGRSEGSGVIVTRKVKVDGKLETINFIWTAGHVIDDLRDVRNVININGDSKKIVSFGDAHVVQELNEGGRRVGELKMDARVIKYSDADDYEDLALLMVLKRDFVKESAEFYLDDKKIVNVGTELYHCGSLLGQMGANSLTRGIMSQIGRVHKNKVYDQTTVTAFPGLSGGGVFIVRDDKPKYVGMVTRGSGETFKLMVPVRRISEFAKDMNIEWAINPDIPMPTLEEIEKLPVEGRGKIKPTKPSTDKKQFIFLDGEHAEEFWNLHRGVVPPR